MNTNRTAWALAASLIAGVGAAPSGALADSFVSVPASNYAGLIATAYAAGRRAGLTQAEADARALRLGKASAERAVLLKRYGPVVTEAVEAAADSAVVTGDQTSR